MPSVQYQIMGMDDILRKMKKVGDMKPLGDLLNRAAIIAQKAAIENAPRDTAALQRDIKYSVNLTAFSAKIYTVKPYASVMEFGRRAGMKPPPSSVLLPWLRRHNIPVEMAFVIARSIGKRGIKGRFFMKKGAAQTNQEMPGLVRRMASEFEDVWKKG